MLPETFTPEQAAAVKAYRAARSAFDQASEKADAAFLRYFTKMQAGGRTNGAQAARLANEASYLSADLSTAQGKLFLLDLDPWDVDDADGHEHTFIG